METGTLSDFRPEPFSREGIGSLQRAFTPDEIAEKGLPSLGGAELDFKVAPCIREALVKYAENGYFGFTVCDDAYRERIQWWMANARGWDIEGEWVVPVLGTIFSVATCLRMLVGPDDAMIVQPPVYYRYEQAARRLGLRCVHNDMKLVGDRYEMDLEGLERLMADSHNKLLVLCNPTNPTGRVWSYEELLEVARLSERYGTIVLSDEIFAEYAFDGRKTVPYASIPEGRANAIALTSVGKAFGCTGLNFANAIIPDERLRERFEAQRTRDHFGSIDPFGRRIMMAAYTPEGLAWQRDAAAYVSENRAIVRKAVESIPGCRMFPVEGTYVSWVEWGGLSLSGEELNSYLKEKAMLVLEPGMEYGEGCERFSRINLGGIHEQLSAAMERLVKATKDILV